MRTTRISFSVTVSSGSNFDFKKLMEQRIKKALLLSLTKDRSDRKLRSVCSFFKAIVQILTLIY